MTIGSTTKLGPLPVQSGWQQTAAQGGNVLPGAPARDAAVTQGSDAAAAAAALAADKQRLQQHFQAFIAQHDQEAHFSYDKGTGLTIVRIINRASGELVRQIPTEEVIRIAQYLNAQNAFLDVKA